MSRHAKQGRPDRDPEHAPVDLGRLRAELQAMQPNRRGGGYRPATCPVCQEDRRGEEWVGRKGDPERMCERCFTEGRAYPRISNRRAREEGRTMPPEILSETPPALKSCPNCGKKFKATRLGPHMAKMHRLGEAKTKLDRHGGG